MPLSTPLHSRKSSRTQLHATPSEPATPPHHGAGRPLPFTLSMPSPRISSGANNGYPSSHGGGTNTRPSSGYFTQGPHSSSFYHAALAEVHGTLYGTKAHKDSVIDCVNRCYEVDAGV